MKKINILLAISLIFALAATGCGGTASSTASSAAPPASESGGATAQSSSGSGTGGGTVIKLAHAAAPGSARDLGAQKLKEVVEAETKGAVTVEIYPASQLGGGPDLIQGMQLGSIEMVILPSSFMGGFQPLTTIMDIPFLFPDDYEKLMAVEAGPAGQKLKDSTSEVGITTLDIWHTGYKTFTCNSPLNTPANFKGKKFRVMPSQIQIAQYELLGAAAINMDFSETYNSLQTGTIDGQENPLDTTFDMKFHEVQKYLTITHHGVLDQFIMASKVWFDALDPTIRAAIVKGCEEGREVAVQNTHLTEEKALKAFRDAGMEIKELTAEERAQWVEALAPIKETYVKNYGEAAREMLDLFEAEIAKS